MLFAATGAVVMLRTLAAPSVREMGALEEML
jgi:hypothetical protein